jgi:hypothetical protein
MVESVVKVDSELLKRVEELIRKDNNRIKYSSKKQFIDVAVLRLLEAESNINSKTRIIKKKEGRNGK